MSITAHLTSSTGPRNSNAARQRQKVVRSALEPERTLIASEEVQRGAQIAANYEFSGPATMAPLSAKTVVRSPSLNSAVQVPEPRVELD